MTLDIILVLLLFGHVLGDFYFQSDEVAINKDKDPKYMFIHCGIYTLCMAATLGIGIAPSKDLAFLLLFVSLVHFCIDIHKKHIKKKPFIIDQLLHLFSFGIALRVWGKCLQVQCYALSELACFPSRPIIVIALGLLIILRPTGLLISKGEIWDFSKSKNAPDESQKGAGRMIGYLERIIVFFLLLNGQYSPIAFVIAAKSVARFPEINEKGGGRSLAEYYLIGTLLSMVCVFSVTLLLGLAKAA